MNHLDPQRAAAAFLRLLDEAAKSVADPWFQLPYVAHDAPAPERAYRERVYCYELYHQIRCRADGPVKTGELAYVLSGEIDKNGLKVIKNGRYKPDLVWHVPGDQNRNSVVVEVKATVGLKSRGMRKDIATLGAFLDMSGPRYACGVLLLYGPGPAEKLRQRALRAADKVQAGDNGGRRSSKTPSQIPSLTEDARGQIRLMLHPGVGQGLDYLGTLEAG